MAKRKDYRHSEKALMRPEAGAQQTFNAKKPPQTYRYDSSLAPELRWDEATAAVEHEVDGLLDKIANAENLKEAQAALSGNIAGRSAFDPIKMEVESHSGKEAPCRMLEVDHLADTTSAHFLPGEQKQIAVKVIDPRGQELLVVEKIGG